MNKLSKNKLSKKDVESVIAHYNNSDNQTRLIMFQRTVMTFFTDNPNLKNIIHSVKTRLKDPEHLRDKILRKYKEGRVINAKNLFKEVTDLIGVRILHLHQEQFLEIHKNILAYINRGDWVLVEKPKAYTWDPEYKNFYEKQKIKTELKETYYTSVHYVIKPNNQESNPICCEIQVRTLFDEIWGEIDHSINYPHPIKSIACKEQLKVLARLVSTGTRLADSIFRSLSEHNNKIC